MMEEELKMPQKKYFRQRAHSNPLSDHELDYPANPAEMNWSEHFPKYFTEQQKEDEKKVVEVVDIGCGYGGLLVNLAKILPDHLSLGMEIRVKVSSYVRTRIRKLRSDAEAANTNKEENGEAAADYQNVACIRANAMKHMPNFFRKHQLRKAFILFPDPHFKRQKLKWRVVSPLLLAEYAYVLAPRALVYTITDVLDVHHWMVKCFEQHPLFERVAEDELKDDPCYAAMFVTTEEGKKVARNGGDKYPAVFRRL